MKNFLKLICIFTICLLNIINVFAVGPGDFITNESNTNNGSNIIMNEKKQEKSILDVNDDEILEFINTDSKWINVITAHDAFNLLKYDFTSKISLISLEYYQKKVEQMKGKDYFLDDKEDLENDLNKLYEEVEKKVDNVLTVFMNKYNIPRSRIDNEIGNLLSIITTHKRDTIARLKNAYKKLDEKE